MLRNWIARTFSGHPEAAQLRLYHDRELPAAVRQRMWDHLLRCSRCSEELRTIGEAEAITARAEPDAAKILKIREALFAKVQRQSTDSREKVNRELHALLGTHVLAQIAKEPDSIPSNLMQELRIFVGAKAAARFDH